MNKCLLADELNRICISRREFKENKYSDLTLSEFYRAKGYNVLNIRELASINRKIYPKR